MNRTTRSARGMGHAVMMTALASALLWSTSCATGKKQPMGHAVQTGFAGTWQIEATEPTGAAQGARFLVFRPDGRYAALDPDRRELWGGTYEIDPTRNPPRFDHRSDESVSKNVDALGIYHLAGDRLTFACVVGTWNGSAWDGRPRPLHLEIGEADAVLHLRRVTHDQVPAAWPGHSAG